MTGPVESRELLAELLVLARFSRRRGLAGYDYGGGQRHADLGRRSRQLETAGIELDRLAAVAAGDRHGAELELVELRAAFERVGRPKLQRVLAESYRANTPASRRTRQAWIDTAVELGLDVDVVHLSTGSSTVACGARMADTAGDGGWDLGDTSVAFRDVTCPACRLAVWRRQGISDRYLEHGGQLVEVLT